jgi:hypothetical protein
MATAKLKRKPRPRLSKFESYKAKLLILKWDA